MGRTLQEADRVYRDLPADNPTRQSAQRITCQMQSCLIRVEKDVGDISGVMILSTQRCGSDWNWLDGLSKSDLDNAILDF